MHPIPNVSTSSINFVPIDTETVYRLLKMSKLEVNDSSDFIPGLLLHKCAVPLTYPLYYIFSCIVGTSSNPVPTLKNALFAHH